METSIDSTCSTCKAYHPAKPICIIKPQYGRCSTHTMVDTMSDGTEREETRRFAARFANDVCEEWEG